MSCSPHAILRCLWIHQTRPFLCHRLILFQAQTALVQSDWNLEQAVSLYYASQDAPVDDSDNDDDETLHQPASSLPQSRPAPSAPTPSARPPPQQPRMRTFRDLQNDAERDDDDHSDHDPNQDFFAGGEKSGLAVQNPNNRPTDHFRNIMQQARECVT